jgi:hypothetical protein
MYNGESSVLTDGISALLLMFNSAINFIIYCTMGTKFRGQLIQILPPFCLILCKQGGNANSDVDTLPLNSEVKNLNSEPKHDSSSV